MDDNTVRIVFYSDGYGEVEKVPQRGTERCFACEHEVTTCLTPEKIEEIGREAARAIGNRAHGCWYDGLIDELIRLYPNNIIRRVVEQHPATVEAALSRRGV